MIIPFFIPHSGCPHQCVFCNQKNITGQNRPADIASIRTTIIQYLNNDNTRKPAQIAFYGGSFTALPTELQRQYLETALPFIRAGQIRNIRLSTRPDGISNDILALLKEYGVTTVELGAQSMDDRVLTLAGRGHSAKDTVRAIHLLRESGFTTGLQLMPGLPGDSAAGFMNTVLETIGLRPDFVRIYPALVIKGTRLEELYAAGHYTPLSQDNAVSLSRDALLKFEQAGIKVVRVGLQPTEELEKPGTVLAGPYHPAFRQLVESSLLLDKMIKVLQERKIADASATILVNPGELSSAIGQKSFNREALKKQFNLQEVHILPDANVSKRTIQLKTA